MSHPLAAFHRLALGLHRPTAAASGRSGWSPSGGRAPRCSGRTLTAGVVTVAAVALLCVTSAAIKEIPASSRGVQSRPKPRGSSTVEGVEVDIADAIEQPRRLADGVGPLPRTPPPSTGPADTHPKEPSRRRAAAAPRGGAGRRRYMRKRRETGRELFTGSAKRTASHMKKRNWYGVLPRLGILLTTRASTFA